MRKLRITVLVLFIAVGLVWNWSLRFNVAANVAAGSAVSLQCAQEKTVVASVMPSARVASRHVCADMYVCARS